MSPLTMTAEQEVWMRKAYVPSGKDNCAEELFRELDAERAAHQEILLAYRTIEALLGVLDHSESVDEGVLIKAVNDKVSKLVTTHQETQAKLTATETKLEISRTQTKDAFFRVAREFNERIADQGSANGRIDSILAGFRTERIESQRKLAETQAIARELLAGAIKYHDQQECAWCYDDGQCDLVDLIGNAKAKGVLLAQARP